jgi:hypothetical protein
MIFHPRFSIKFMLKFQCIFYKKVVWKNIHLDLGLHISQNIWHTFLRLSTYIYLQRGALRLNIPDRRILKNNH